jgi:hypothetical protein
MPNRLTDHYKLVETSTVKGFLSLFKRTVSVADGFSLEIFHGDAHVGSILSDSIKLANDVTKRSKSMGASDGDTIVRVSLGSFMPTLEGTLFTRDGYVRRYEIVVEMCVYDPRAFAILYRQEKDPLFLAKTAIEGAFQRYADRNTHDSMDPANLRYEAEAALSNATNQHYGLKVVRAHRTILAMDAKRAKELEIIQQARVTETQIRSDAVLEGIRIDTRTENAKKELVAKAQTQRMEDAIEVERIELFDKVNRGIAQRDHHQEQQKKVEETIVNALLDRVKQDIAMGRPLNEIFEEQPHLRALYTIAEQAGVTTALPSIEERKRLDAPTNRPNEGGDEGTRSSEYTRRQATDPSLQWEMNRQVRSAYFGLTLAQAELSPGQRSILRVRDNVAFQVVEIVPGGLAQRAGLMINDLIVSMDGAPLCDTQSTSELLKSIERGSSITMRVMRGERRIDLYI